MIVTTTFQDFVANAGTILADETVSDVVLDDTSARLAFNPPTSRRRDWRVKLYRKRRIVAEWDGWETRAEMASGVASALFSIDLSE